jgi:hypothetical protein
MHHYMYTATPTKGSLLPTNLLDLGKQVGSLEHLDLWPDSPYRLSDRQRLLHLLQH